MGEEKLKSAILGLNEEGLELLDAIDRAGAFDIVAVGDSRTKLAENIEAFISHIKKIKPSGAKGQYVRSAFLTTTMGPGIRLDLRPTLALTSG